MPETGASINKYPAELGHPESRQGQSVCWNCEKNLSDEDICPSCVKVQPFGSERDYFSILGIPGRLTLDPRLLVSAYHEKSRAFHPDHHVGDSNKEQSITLGNSSLVNLAFRTLRDPFLRAQYLIEKLKGDPAKPHRKPTLSPQDLMEIMELKEELESLTAEKGPAVAEQRVRTILDPLEQDIFDSFPDIDTLVESGEPQSKELIESLSTLAERLEKRSYLQNLLREIKEAS